MSNIQQQVSVEQWFELSLFFVDHRGEPLLTEERGEPLLTEERWQALQVVRSVGSRREPPADRLASTTLGTPIIGPPGEVVEATGGTLHFVNYTRQGSRLSGQPVQPSIHCYAENVAEGVVTEKILALYAYAAYTDIEMRSRRSRVWAALQKGLMSAPDIWNEYWALPSLAQATIDKALELELLASRIETYGDGEALLANPIGIDELKGLRLGAYGRESPSSSSSEDSDDEKPPVLSSEDSDDENCLANVGSLSQLEVAVFCGVHDLDIEHELLDQHISGRVALGDRPSADLWQPNTTYIISRCSRLLALSLNALPEGVQFYCIELKGLLNTHGAAAQLEFLIQDIVRGVEGVVSHYKAHHSDAAPRFRSSRDVKTERQFGQVAEREIYFPSEEQLLPTV
jgi:hypothetical protein